MATAPKFIDYDPSTEVNELIALFESYLDKKLQPAQPERVLIDAIAYRMTVKMSQIDLAARSLLVNYANGQMLDELGALVGCTRLPAAIAGTTIRFNVTPAGGTVSIPAFTRVRSNDGKATFYTLNDTDVTEDMAFIDIQCECETEGEAYNGYLAGSITEILDPLPFVTTAANTTTSGGGADIETDDHYRERIKLAVNAFSVAGSRDAYKYWAFTANPDIVDVDVTSPTAGTVQVYVLGKNGTTPTEMVDDVLAVLSGEKVRPLTDTVLVNAPDYQDIDIEVYVSWMEGYDKDLIEQNVTAALEAYKAKLQSKMGLDLRQSRLIATFMGVDGVFDGSIIQPPSDVDSDPGQVVRVNSITVNMAPTASTP